MQKDLIVLIILALATFSCYAQLQQGIESFEFGRCVKFVFDERAGKYVATGAEVIKGEIIISYLDNTIQIKSPGSVRNFKLGNTTVEPNTFRTLREIMEGGTKFVLANEFKYFTLIGAKDKIIYERAK